MGQIMTRPAARILGDELLETLLIFCDNHPDGSGITELHHFVHPLMDSRVVPDEAQLVQNAAIEVLLAYNVIERLSRNRKFRTTAIGKEIVQEIFAIRQQQQGQERVKV